MFARAAVSTRAISDQTIDKERVVAIPVLLKSPKPATSFLGFACETDLCSGRFFKDTKIVRCNFDL
jgi:hypothetical protein